MNLLDPIWIIVPFIIGTILTTLVLKHSQKLSFKNRPGITRLFMGLIIIISLLIAIYYLVLAIVGDVAIPLTLIIWFLPFAFASSLILLKPKLNETRVKYIFLSFTLIAFLVGGVLSLNSYYSFCSSIDCETPLANAGHTRISNEVLPFEAIYRQPRDEPKTGEVTALTIPSTTPNFKPGSGFIYLPPVAISRVNIPLPVIILVGGHPGEPSSWLKTNIIKTLDTFARDHHGLAPIVAQVDQNGINDNDTECLNSPLGDAETYIVNDVPTYIKSHYPASFNPKEWTIGGLSAGGTCAEVTALKHNNIYGNFMTFSAPTVVETTPASDTLSVLFAGNKDLQGSYNTSSLIDSPKTPRSINMAFVIGTSDTPSYIIGFKQQVALARKLHYNVFSWCPTGGHTFSLWSDAFSKTLPWMMRQINFTR